METLLKILRLIPDNWIHFLEEAEVLEQNLVKRKGYLEGYKTKLDTLIRNLFQEIDTLDFGAFKTKFHGNRNFQKFEKVSLNFFGLLSLPEDFDSDNMDDIRDLVITKVELLKDVLSDVEIENFDSNTVLDHLKEIALVILKPIPEDMDFNDREAVLQLKNDKLAQLQPKVLDLMEYLLPFELDRGSLETNVQTFNDVANTVFSPHTPETDDEKEAMLEDEYPILSNIKNKIPQVRKTLADVTIPGINTAQISDHSKEVVEEIEDKIPEIEKLLNELDWENLESDTIVDKAETVFGHLKEILKLPLFHSVFPLLKEQFKFINLRDMDIKTLIAELERLVDIPDDVGLHDIPKVVALARTKVDELLDLISHVEIEGVDTKKMLAALRDFFDQLFKDLPEDLSLDNPADLCAVFFDKAVSFFQIQNSEKTQKAWLEILQKIQMIWQFVRSSGIHVDVKDQIDLHSEPPQNSVPPRMINVQGDLMEEKSIFEHRVTSATLIADPDGKADTAPMEQEVSFETPQETVNNDTPPSKEIPDAVEHSDPTLGISTSDTTAQVVEEQQEAAESGSSPDLDPEPIESQQNMGQDQEASSANDTSFKDLMGQWIQALLDDEKGLSEALDPAQKEILLSYFEGTLKNTLIDSFKALVDQPCVDLIEELKSRWQTFETGLLQDGFYVSRDGEEMPFTVGTLIDYLLDEFSAILILIRGKIEELVLEVIKWLYDLLDIAMEILANLKVPKSRIPLPLFNLITQKRDPNILCLIMVLPVATVKSILNMTSDDMDGWLASAAEK